MSDEVEKTDPLGEPSVLDYVKSLFHFGNGERIRIPGEEKASHHEQASERHAFLTEVPVLRRLDDVERELSFVEAPSSEFQPEIEPVPEQPAPPFPWRSLLAFLLA